MVPHGRGHHVPYVRSPNNFGDFSEAYGGLITQELPSEPHLTLGRPRRAHVQEPLAKKAHAAVSAGASDRSRPRDNLRQVARALPQALRPSARVRHRARLHRMGHPRAGSRGVAQSYGRTALRRWQNARAAALARHQGVAGGHTAVHGATRRRSRHTDAFSPVPQQQPNSIMSPPWGISLPLPLSPTRTTMLRGATQNLRGEAPHIESQPTSEITPPHTSSFHSCTRPPIRRIVRPPKPQHSLHIDARATHALAPLPTALASV
jgi:hypothetical protein